MRGAAGWATSTSPATIRRRAGRSPVTSAVLQPARTPLSTSRAPRTWRTIDDKGFLYFSSSSAVVPGDIYVSQRLSGWNFGGSVPAAGLNDAGANDIQPNVRKDGLEVVFSSNRVGGIGAQDIWISTRASFDAPWSTAVSVGAAVNTAAAETRPSLSRNARQLLFRARARPGGHRRHLRQHPHRPERELISAPAAGLLAGARP